MRKMRSIQWNGRIGIKKVRVYVMEDARFRVCRGTPREIAVNKRAPRLKLLIVTQFISVTSSCELPKTRSMLPAAAKEAAQKPAPEQTSSSRDTDNESVIPVRNRGRRIIGLHLVSFHPPQTQPILGIERFLFVLLVRTTPCATWTLASPHQEKGPYRQKELGMALGGGLKGGERGVKWVGFTWVTFQP